MAVAQGPSASASSAAAPRIATLDLLLLVALAVFWGSAYIFIRVGIENGASPILYADVRYAISAAIFAGLAAGSREKLPARRPLLVSAGIGGTLVIGLYGGLLYWGEQFTTGGYASVLSCTAPILTVVIAYPILPSERFGRVALVGVLLGFLGAVLLVYPELAGGAVGVWPGPAFILAAFLVTVIGSVLIRRLAPGRQGFWQLGSEFAVAALLLTVATAVLPVGDRLPSSAPVLESLAGLVVLSSVGGYFVYFTLHHRVGPVRANLVAYLLPLVGVGLGSGLLGEPLTVWEVGGFVVVCAGVTLVLRASRAAP